MATHRISMTNWRPATAAAILLTLIGCSTLEGGRFNHEASQSGTTLDGVPFTLNRPVPTITRTPGDTDTPDKYMVKLVYEPDPSQRYTLQLDPAWFASADFDMSYDANGSLTDSSAKVTEQLVQGFTAVAKLALAAGVYDRADANKDFGLLKELEAEGDIYFSDPKAKVFDTLNGQFRAATPADRAAWRKLIGDLQTMAAEKNVRKSFFYQTPVELDLLQTMLRYRRAKLKLNDVIDQYDAQFDALKSSEKTYATAVEIDAALRRFDQRQLTKIRATLIADRAKLRAAEELNLYNGDGAALKVNYKLKEFSLKAELPKMDSLLADIADLEHVEWQRRMIAWLNKQIDDRRYVLQINSTQGSVKEVETKDALLTEILDRKAAVLGVLPERKRRLAILASLARAPLPKDYDNLRAEMAALEATEAAAEVALKQKVAESKAEDPRRAELLNFSAQESVQDSLIKSRLANKLGGTTGERLPRYVVALQPTGLITVSTSPGTAQPAPVPAVAGGALGAPAAAEVPAVGGPPLDPPPAAVPSPKKGAVSGQTTPVKEGGKQ